MLSDYTDITLILDRSGSMLPARDDTIGTVNAYLRAQRDEPGLTRVTLYSFNERVSCVFTGLAAKDAPDLSRESYHPSGQTALLQAMGGAMTDTGQRLAALPWHQRPGKVLFVVVTDGLDNVPGHYSRERVMDMVKHQEDLYSWTFVYLGANQDAIANAASLGIAAGNTLNFDTSQQGLRVMSGRLANATSTYKAGDARETKKFFA